MSFIEKQPDNRTVCMDGVFHIEPIIQPNKFDAHNYNLEQLLDLGDLGLLQYNESIKAGVGYEYLGACKNGLFKLYKALAYYSMIDTRAIELRERIAKSIRLSDVQERPSCANTDNTLDSFKNTDRSNMKQSQYYAKNHDDYPFR